MAAKKSDVFITYRHFKRKSGAVTACCLVLLTDNRMLVGFAFCSPEDQFNKQIGRAIAHGRMRKQPISINLNAGDQSSNERPKLGIADAVIDYLRNVGDLTSIDALLQVRSYRPDTESGNFVQWFPCFQDEL